MPALTKSKVGSFCGTSGEEATTSCPFFSKKPRNVLRISLRLAIGCSWMGGKTLEQRHIERLTLAVQGHCRGAACAAREEGRPVARAARVVSAIRTQGSAAGHVRTASTDLTRRRGCRRRRQAPAHPAVLPVWRRYSCAPRSRSRRRCPCSP